MNKFIAVLNLIRWRNLLLIALTQILVYFFIVAPGSENLFLSYFDLSILICTTLLIAAAGYLINDYFDVRIDQINKPHKVIIGKKLSRKSAVVYHVLANLLALVLCFFVARKTNLFFITIQVISILLLLEYSLSFKRKLLIGNFIIACLTALSILCIGVYENNFISFSLATPYHYFFWLYLSFAFVITFIRELIKDIEDLPGDSKENCNTMPIRYGIRKTKWLIYFLFALLFLLILIFIVLQWKAKLWLCIYLFGLVFIPSLFLIKKIHSHVLSSQFSALSQQIKWLSLLGILSIFLIRI